jgi:hypothetical protein
MKEQIDEGDMAIPRERRSSPFYPERLLRRADAPRSNVRALIFRNDGPSSCLVGGGRSNLRHGHKVDQILAKGR